MAWEGEISLDLDAVSAICPNCKIVLVEADTAYNVDLVQAEAAAAAAGATQISNSWSGHDSLDPSYFTFPGVAVVAASGDSGYDRPPRVPGGARRRDGGRRHDPGRRDRRPRRARLQRVGVGA